MASPLDREIQARLKRHRKAEAGQSKAEGSGSDTTPSRKRRQEVWEGLEDKEAGKDTG